MNHLGDLIHHFRVYEQKLVGDEPLLTEQKEALATDCEAIHGALLDQLVNPRAYEPMQLLGEELSAGLVQAGENLSAGLAWAGFWTGLGAVLVAAILKWG